MSEVKVLTFDKARVDVPRDGGIGRSFGHPLFGAKEHACGDVYDAAFPAPLYYLGVQQLGRRTALGIPRTTSFPGSLHRVFNTIGF